MPSRSRAGCPRCRSLKIKCDESRPQCRQCSKRRVICPGYRRDLKWINKHEVFSLFRTSTAENTSPNQLSLPDVPLLVAQSAQTLQGPRNPGENAAPIITPPQRPEDAAVVAFQLPTYEFSNENDKSATDILRDDLREWFANHDPTTLLEPHDWVEESGISCTTSTFATVLDCQGSMAGPQGTEFNQALVQYFFDNLCRIHTVLDDTAETFKALVRRYLSSSPLLHKSIVCMAAVHCFQDEDSMLTMCLECHSAAVTSLSEAVFEIESVLEQSAEKNDKSALSDSKMLRKLEETLLASIVLGFCAPWSDPRDLGLPHLRGARKLCEYLINHVTMNGKAPENALANTDHHFLIGAMAYWEACMSFVVDQPRAVLTYLYPFCRPTETTYVHTFAGISLQLLVILGRVGICVRHNRALRNMVGVGWKDSNAYQLLASEVEEEAIELAEHAVNFRIPCDESLDMKSIDPFLHQQLKAYAQMCRFAILLELQSNFASLTNTQASPAESSLARTLKHNRLEYELSGAILSYAQDIPEGSTCGLYQTILLIICGSVLRASKTPDVITLGKVALQDRLEAEIQTTLTRTDELEKRRAFIRRRLQSNCISFGLRQVFSRAELLLENIWTELDANTASSDDNYLRNRYWIDVMADHKLETFFG